MSLLVGVGQSLAFRPALSSGAIEDGWHVALRVAPKETNALKLISTRLEKVIFLGAYTEGVQIKTNV